MQEKTTQKKTLNETELQTLQRLKRALLVCLAIFVLSTLVLIARLLYLVYVAPEGETVIVPDNLVGLYDRAQEKRTYTELVLQRGGASRVAEEALSLPTELLMSASALRGTARQSAVTAEVLELFAGQDSDTTPFQAENMFPGDTVEKYYCLKLYHDGAMTVYFDLEKLSYSKGLGEVLQIKLTQQGEPAVTLFAGSFADLKKKTLEVQVPASETKETLVYYKIEVSLPTSAGNEVQGAELSVDFCWYAEKPEVPVTTTTATTPSPTTPTPPVTTIPSTTRPTETEPPETEPQPPVTTAPAETTAVTPPPETRPIPPETEPAVTSDGGGAVSPATTTTPPPATTTEPPSGGLVRRPIRWYLLWPFLVLPSSSLLGILVILILLRKLFGGK